MSQRDTRSIAGVYRVGQVISDEGIVVICTAYNLNTNDVVGLYLLDLAPSLHHQTVEAIRQHLQPLSLRSGVRSPHVLKLHDWGIDGQRAYIATDPPRGITLRHALDTENISIARSLGIIRQIVEGVKALHEKGVVGLDLRPQLITIDTIEATDRTQIDDIGLRSLLSALLPTKQEQQHVYTETRQAQKVPHILAFVDPRYTPPEGLQSIDSDNIYATPESDIYQVGLLLFELITGRLPFVGRDYTETATMQQNDPVPAMRQYTYNLPPILQAIVDRALAKDAKQRYRSADALLKDLKKTEDPISGSSTSYSTDPSASAPGLTIEMSPLAGDIALEDTLIEKHSPPATAPDEDESSAWASEPAYAYLCLEQQGVITQRFALKEKSNVVGRSDPKRRYTPDIDISQLDVKMTVSRQHARIRFEETFFSIEDLKSRNKTRLNELPLIPFKSELLKHGDIIHFGAVRMIFEIDQDR